MWRVNNGKRIQRIRLHSTEKDLSSASSASDPVMSLIQLLGVLVDGLHCCGFCFVFSGKGRWLWTVCVHSACFFLCWNIIYLIIYLKCSFQRIVIWSEAQIKSWSVTEDESYFPCAVNALSAPAVFLVLLSRAQEPGWFGFCFRCCACHTCSADQTKGLSLQGTRIGLGLGLDSF